MQKPASQGSKLAGKGTYRDVSNRRGRVRAADAERKKLPLIFLIRTIFAFAGFVSNLKRAPKLGGADLFGARGGGDGE